MFSNEQLTSPDFDEVAYLRYALRASSFSTEHTRLEHCIAEVKEGMQAILADHADELIDQARCTHKAQREVSSVRQSTDSLQKATGRLRLMIEEPYHQLQSRVRELEATQEAMQLLQSTLRFLSLTGRLHEQLAATPSIDVVRAAYTLRELEEVLQDDAIRSLQVVDAQLPTVERHAASIRSKAHELLAMTELTSSASSAGGSAAAAAGSSGSSSATTTSRLATNVSTGLQCAYVLRTLSRTVQSFMTERRREVLRTVMRELDTQAIEEHVSAEYERLSQTPQAGGGTSEQAVTAFVVLQHIQKTLFIAVQHTQCVLLLWRLVLQRRDAQTQAPYVLAIESPVQLLVEYWTTITEKIRERLGSLQKRHAIRLALASAYPRYHHLVASFLSRTDTAGVAEGAIGASSSSSSSASAAGVGHAGTGMSSGGGGGGAGAASAAALASSIHVTQCGMGDFLDLIDLVDSAVRRGAAAAAEGTLGRGDGSPFATPAKAAPFLSSGPGAAGSRMDTHDLRHTWLAQVTDEVRDAFRTYVMDRHRELVGGVLSRLSSVLPASPAMGGQPAAVAPVRMQGIRRPPIPQQANALDLTVYTRMITQEVQMFRQDPHTLDVLLDCILTSLRQLRSRLSDAVKRFPLPPLPAITAAPTLVQVLHLSIANGCTTLAYDCATVLACVPQPAAWVDGGEGASRSRPAHVDPLAAVLEQLGTKRMELQQLISALQEMAERSSRPFVDSAVAVLVPTLTQATDSVLRNEFATSAAATVEKGGRLPAPMAGGDSRTALVQLQSQCRQFTDRFFFLVDPRTSGWTEACQHMTDTLLTCLLARLATWTPPPPPLPQQQQQGSLAAMAPACARTLQHVMPALVQYIQVIQSAGAAGRTTSLLRGCVRQVEAFYDACGDMGRGVGGPTALRAAMMERLRPPVPAVLARLLVVQYALFRARASGSGAAEGPMLLATALHLPEPAVMECVQATLLEESAAAVAAPAPSRPASAEGGERRGKAELVAATEACYRQLLAAAPADAAAQLEELWGSVAAEGV